MSDRADNFFMGLVIGGVLGALVGVLFAPKSGRELREELGGKAEEALIKAKEDYQETLEKSKKAYDTAVSRLNKLEAAAGEKIEEVVGKASSILKKEGQEHP
jgi:gas vesicle protein